MKKKLNIIVLVIAIAVFLYSGYQLYEIFSEYQKGVKEYDTLQEIAFGLDVPEVQEGKAPQTKQVDFKALKKINPDIVGWIEFDEPKEISYPLVKGADNAKYLSTTFEGQANSAGALFLDAENAADFSDTNTFIYGHNMKNGSMFGKLREYKDKAFWEKYPCFRIYTPDGECTTYRICFVSIVKDASESYQKWFNDAELFDAYVEHLQSVALYETGVEVTHGSRLVSLSTCTNTAVDERLMVSAVAEPKEAGDE